MIRDDPVSFNAFINHIDTSMVINEMKIAVYKIRMKRNPMVGIHFKQKLLLNISNEVLKGTSRFVLAYQKVWKMLKSVVFQVYVKNTKFHGMKG